MLLVIHLHPPKSTGTDLLQKLRFGLGFMQWIEKQITLEASSIHRPDLGTLILPCGDSFSASPFTYSWSLTFTLSSNNFPGTCCPPFPLKPRFFNSATQIKYLEHACFNPDIFTKISQYCHLDRAISYLNQQNFGIV